MVYFHFMFTNKLVLAVVYNTIFSFGFFSVDRRRRNRCCERNRRQNRKKDHKFKLRHHPWGRENFEYTTKKTPIKKKQQWIIRAGERRWKCTHFPQWSRAETTERSTKSFSVSSKKHSIVRRKWTRRQDYNFETGVRIYSFSTKGRRKTASLERRWKEKKCCAFEHTHETYKEQQEKMIGTLFIVYLSIEKKNVIVFLRRLCLILFCKKGNNLAWTQLCSCCRFLINVVCTPLTSRFHCKCSWYFDTNFHKVFATFFTMFILLWIFLYTHLFTVGRRHDLSISLAFCYQCSVCSYHCVLSSQSCSRDWIKKWKFSSDFIWSSYINVHSKYNF